MNCQKFREYLYQYLDQELPQDIVNQMEAHLSACPLCQLEFEREKKFDAAIRTYAVREEAPFALREAVIQQLENKKKKFSWKSVFARQLAPVFVLLTIIIAVIIYQRFNAGPAFPVFSEVVENHLEYLRGIYPLEFQTSDIKEALAWFRGKTDFAVTPPHINLNKVNLVGGRIVHLKDKKSAYFLLEKDGYKISAFYTDLHDVDQPKASAKEGIKAMGPRLVKTEKGYHVIYCFHKDDGTACILVSDMPLEELEELIV